MIIFEHADFIVVNKPAPLLVHRHSRFPKEYPLLQQIRDKLGHYVWPIHRLDRQTSGCVIMARRQELVFPLSRALQNGSKFYLALVRGRLTQEGAIEVNTAIKKSKSKYQEAHSTVWSLGHNEAPRCSLVQAQAHTGRHHQIRRHLRDLNHPILHDGDHGDSRVNRWWREEYGLSRLALHAYRIDIEYSNTTHQFIAPFPQDLMKIVKQLSWWPAIQSSHSIFSAQWTQKES